MHLLLRLLFFLLLGKYIIIPHRFSGGALSGHVSLTKANTYNYLLKEKKLTKKAFNFLLFLLVVYIPG